MIRSPLFSNLLERRTILETGLKRTDPGKRTYDLSSPWSYNVRGSRVGRRCPTQCLLFPNNRGLNYDPDLRTDPPSSIGLRRFLVGPVRDPCLAGTSGGVKSRWDSPRATPLRDSVHLPSFLHGRIAPGTPYHPSTSPCQDVPDRRTEGPLV